MNKNEALEHLLPTPSARWSVLLTGVLLTPAFLAPPFLKPLLWPTASDKELLLLQLLASILVLLIGSFVVLMLVIRAYREQEKLHQAEISALKTKKPKPPSPPSSPRPSGHQSWMAN